MSPFQAIQQQAISAVDAVMAEAVLVYPLSKGMADTTRAHTELRCVLRVGNVRDQNVAGDLGKAWSQRIALGKAEAHIDQSAYAGLDIRKGDKLRAVDRPGQPWFEVLTVNERAQGRTVLALGEAG